LRQAQNYGVSKGGEHPLCDILIGGGVKSPPAKWLRLIDLTWDELVRTPSRLTAEPIHRDQRATLLAAVSRQVYIDNYRGVRISKTGRRFMIEQATVWNLLAESGGDYGQAATFSAWKFIEPTEQA